MSYQRKQFISFLNNIILLKQKYKVFQIYFKYIIYNILDIYQIFEILNFFRISSLFINIY